MEVIGVLANQLSQTLNLNTGILNNGILNNSGTDSIDLNEAKKHTDDSIAALDVIDNAVSNQFVTAVSETDGKIKVSRTEVVASQISILNTETDAFAASTTNVQTAINELADMWGWDEF